MIPPRKTNEAATGEIELLRRRLERERRVRKAAEEIAECKTQDIFEAKRQVENALAERTLELVAARNEAIAAKGADSGFLSHVSHDIRMHINVILGMSYLALQADMDGRQRNYIEKVHRSAGDLLGIVNEILDFTKIEADDLALENIDFHLEDVLDTLASVIGLKAEDKGLELLFDQDADVPSALVGDPLRLGQVLLNLANNAVKSTAAGEVVVGVRVAAKTERQVELHFRVEDMGGGGGERDLANLYGEASVPDLPAPGRADGTRSGMVVSMRLAEMMGGKLWAERVTGRGSTIHFHALFGIHEETDVRPARRLAGKRVLVVDDSPTARAILAAIAENWGMEAAVAEDGAAALAATERERRAGRPFDLVLMDWNMPGIDGIECARQLMAQEGEAAGADSAAAIIAVTAYGREQALNAARRQGVVLRAAVNKPVRQSALLGIVERVLAGGSGDASAEEVQQDAMQRAMAKLAGTKVLLVEDDAGNRELALELLSRAGMTVVVAEDGKRALEVLDADGEGFDGVLMDCQMPVMDGYAVTREIRRRADCRDLPILAMTADAMAGDREKARMAGMNDYIAKPLDLPTLYVAMARWFADGRS